MSVERETNQDIDPKRKKLVSDIIDEVKKDKEHWMPVFKQMKENKKFVSGHQWPGEDKLQPDEKSYVANVTYRHIKQRTAAIYARNPKFNFRKSKRLNYKIWDGTAQSILEAQAILQSVEDQTAEPALTALAVIEDAKQGQQQSMALEKIGQTLTILYDYFMREQATHTKTMMKRAVQMALTCKVGYIKQSYQQVLQDDPDITRQIADHRSNLDKIEQIADDIEDDIIPEDDGEAERLRLMIEQLESRQHILLREGLVLDYPESDKIIPDRNMTYIQEFIGCDRVTEEYDLTRAQIQQVYKVDIGDDFKDYTKSTTGEVGDAVTVWEVWIKSENMVYVVVDGYEDFLREPSAPDCETERFWPWFPYAPNATADSENPIPQSDVEQIEPMQREINRAGEALRDHRYASRPGHVTGDAMNKEDANAIQSRAAHAVITLKGLLPDQKISDKLQAIPVSPFDPNLYNTAPAFQDIMRTIGTQEANLGRASGATATETSIAESSRQSSLSSAIDELDDLLSMMARTGGQIMMQKLSEQTVMEIVGVGALWPESDMEQIVKELYLEVEAGSSGRPNQSQEVQVRERVLPLAFQIPGLKPEFFAKDLLRIMDDNINYEDAVDVGSQSIVAINGQAQAAANGGGADNSPRPPGPGPAGPPSQSS